MKRLKFYTDASFKDGVSTHHYRIIGSRGKVIKRRTFKSEEVNSIKAELESISSALKWIVKKDLECIEINTDSMAVVKLLKENKEDKIYRELGIKNLETEASIDYMKFIMKQYDIKIKWVSREHKQIVLADYYCGELMETIFKRKEFQGGDLIGQ